MTTHLDNPAGRLHATLSKLISKGRDYPLRQAWAEAVSSSLKDNTNLAKRVALVLALADQAETAVRALDEAAVNHELLLRWRAPVDEVLGTVVAMENSSTTFVILKLDSGVMYALESCSDALHRYSRGKTVELDTLESLKEAALLLREEVDQPGVDPELRLFIRPLIQVILDAVDEYMFRGADGLQAAYERVFGALRVHGDLVLKNKETHPRVWSQLEKTVGVLASVCIVGTTAVQLTGIVMHELEAASHQQSSSTAIVMPDRRAPDPISGEHVTIKVSPNHPTPEPTQKP